MKKLASLFSSKQTTLGSAAFVMMSMVATSRVLGLVRDRLLSARFSPDELGIYFAAFRLPNLMFELLVTGALTSAFIPVFTKYISQDKTDDAWAMTAALINISIIVFALVTIPIFIWSTEFSRFLAPGYSNEQIALMAYYTRFMIVFQVLPLILGNFFTGILQSYNLFLIPALAPVVYNIGIILGIVALSTTFGLFAPVLGVAIGAGLFMLIQIPSLIHLGYRHKFIWNPKLAGVREVGRLMAPRTIGLAISQIDTTVDLMLSTLLGARMVTIFNFAQHLQQLPIGLFGATIAQAALPLLSQASVKDNRDEFKKTIVSAIHQIIFFVLPVSILFIVLRIPIVRLVFGASRFDWNATVLTGITLSMFSISLAAQAVAHILTRGFYALYDTKTPVAIGVVTILTNTILSIWFIQFAKLPVWSLGLSTSIASILNAAVLLIFLDRRIAKFPRWDLLLPPIKMIVAATLTGIMLYVPLKLFDQLVFDTTRTFGLIMLTGTASLIGLSAYLFLSWVMGVGEVRSFLNLLVKVRRRGTIILEPAHEVVNGGTQDQIS